MSPTELLTASDIATAETLSGSSAITMASRMPKVK